MIQTIQSKVIIINGIEFVVKPATFIHLVILESVVLDVFGISSSAFYGKGKYNEVVEARMVYCWIAYHIYEQTKKSIAKDINRHRTTVLNSINTMQDMIDTNDPVTKKFEQVLKQLPNERI